jgi:hypothetical protein
MRKIPKALDLGFDFIPHGQRSRQVILRDIADNLLQIGSVSSVRKSSIIGART